MGSPPWSLPRLSAFPLLPTLALEGTERKEEDNVWLQAWSFKPGRLGLRSNYYSVWSWVSHLHFARAYILALGTLRQEDCFELHASTGSIVPRLHSEFQAA